jgi:hypothetical protein
MNKPYPAFAYVATDHNCDGSTDTVMTPAAFAAQTYFKADEIAGLTEDVFNRYVLPTMDAHAVKWWAQEGFYHAGGKLPRSVPTHDVIR